ncbi:glycosyltransferase family protein [Amycolatopsis thermoflava]|uniref:glycosyltransferase family protein n=1 Tax=Amycolatopsis thermoflava TaxID=84480 RepID=UPI00381C4622
MTAQLCFVSATGGSGFMAELLEVVADSVRRAGFHATTATGRYPDADADTVYVVVPHEYFVVTPEADQPTEEQRRRTIAFCVEHPGTATFERSAALLPGLAGAVDINHDSTAELRRRGIPVEHFQLGYSPLWDAWGGDPDSAREIDVTYLGTAERRRSKLLASYAGDLADLRVRLLTPPHEPMGPQRVDFLPGEAKFAHLANSRFLLNLHRERSRALEWVRVLEALCNGCVVLTEPSTDLAPLVSGTHLVVTRPESLGTAAAALAADPQRERDLRMAGYEFVRTALDPLASAKTLVELAERVLTASPGVPASPPLAETTAVDEPRPLAIDTPSWDVRFAGTRSLGAPAENPPLATRMGQQTVDARRTSGVEWLPSAAPTVFPDADRAEVDVLLVRRPGEPDPDPLVRDLLAGTVLPRRILVGEDGVAPRPRPRPADLLRHELPLGRGYTRNRLLERSAAPWLLVLDGGLRASRRLLERLVAASAEVDVMHCPVADPVEGLVAALPPEERRLAELPYLGSGYLVRRELVESFGGWTEDPLADGLEDHVFWRRLATRGVPTALVQQVLLSRLRPDPAPRPVDLDPHRVWSLTRILAGEPVTPNG